MTIAASGGSRIFIGTTVPCNVIYEYEADTYIEIEEVEDLGEFGDAANPITFTALKDSRVQKLKGPFDAGTLQMVVGNDTDDPGQEALDAAVPEPFNYNFKVMFNDPLTLGGTPTITYFSAQVMSKRYLVGTANDVTKRRYDLGINTAVLVVPPT